MRMHDERKAEYKSEVTTIVHQVQVVLVVWLGVDSG